MTDFKAELERILVDLYNSALVHGELKTEEFPNHTHIYPLISQAASDIQKLIDEVVIGNEEPNADTIRLGSDNTTPLMERINGRNWLRENQRNRLYGDGS